MINTPRVFYTVWYFVKRWVSARTVNKLIMTTSAHLPDFPPEMIPSLVGGPNNDGMVLKAYPFDLKYFKMVQEIEISNENTSVIQNLQPTVFYHQHIAKDEIIIL